MRAITNGEIERIQNQSLNRISGRSEIAFNLSYFAYYEPPGSDILATGETGSPRTQKWSEEGFFGDFVLMRMEATLLTGMSYLTSAGPASDVLWTAAITLPYQYKDGFYTTQGTNALNRLYKPEKHPGGVATHDTIYSNEIWIKTIDGRPVPEEIPNVYYIVEDPIVTLDGLYFRLEAYGHEGFKYTSGTYSFGAGVRSQPGVGVVDSAGYLSDRFGTKFKYQTTGDLRRLKPWSSD